VTQQEQCLLLLLIALFLIARRWQPEFGDSKEAEVVELAYFYNPQAAKVAEQVRSGSHVKSMWFSYPKLEPKRSAKRTDQ
jgi:hypothetical protein